MTQATVIPVVHHAGQRPPSGLPRMTPVVLGPFHPPARERPAFGMTRLTRVCLDLTIDVATRESGLGGDPDEFTHQRLGVRADLVISHGAAPPACLVHGQGPVMWTTYVNGGSPTRG